MPELEEILKKGKKVSPELRKILEKGKVVSAEQPGFVQSIAQGMTSWALKLASTGASAARGTYKMGEAGVRRVLGDAKGAQVAVLEAAQPVEFGAGYLGRARPIETTKEAIGVGLQAGLTAGTPMLGPAGTILGKAAQFGALGAGFGTGKALEEEAELLEIAKQAFISGFTGAAVGAVAGVAGKVVKKAAPVIAKRLYNSALKITQKINQKMKSPSEALLEKGIWGSLGHIKRKAMEGITQANTKVNQLLQGAQATLKSQDILDDITNQLNKRFGAQYTTKELKEVVNKLPIARLLSKKNITLREVNLLRQQLDRTLGSRFFLSQTQAPVNKEAMGIASNVLRNTVKGTLPAARVVFKDFETFLETSKVVDRAMAQAGKRLGFGLYDILAGIGGYQVAGGPVGGLVGVAARQVARQPFVKTGFATLINKIGQMSTNTAGKVSKTAILNLIKEFSPNVFPESSPEETQ